MSRRYDAEYQRRWRAANPDRVREISRRYLNGPHREEIIAKRNEAARIARAEARASETPEQREQRLAARRERERRYRADHPEKIREWNLRYRQAHLEEVRARGRRWAAENPLIELAGEPVRVSELPPELQQVAGLIKQARQAIRATREGTTP